MTLSNAQARFQLSADAATSQTNSSGTVEVGLGLTTQAFSDADVAYSFEVEATGGSDIATLTFTTGVVVQTAGTPTVTDGDGKDIFGVTISLVRVMAILVEADSAAITCSNSEFPDFADGGQLIRALWVPTTAIASPGTMAIAPSGAGLSTKVTVIGKSS